MPNMGRLVKTNGNMAQCMAHAREAAIPRASKLILNIGLFQLRCKYNVSLQLSCKNLDSVWKPPVEFGEIPIACHLTFALIPEYEKENLDLYWLFRGIIRGILYFFIRHG